MNKILSALQIIKPVQAQTKNWEQINQSCVVDGVATVQGIGCVLANVFSIFLTLLGLTGFVMIIVAAFNLMFSGGKSQEVEKSKNTITFAIIGIIMALSAFIILNLLSSFTGIDQIKTLIIPGSEKNWPTN